MNKDRIYYSMLQKVGTLGKFQFYLALFIILVGIEGSACFLVNPYLFYEQSFECFSDIKNCKEHVCSLPSLLREPYTEKSNGRMSLANQFGDFRCQGSEFVTLLNSSILLGSVIGIFILIFITEWLGRRGTIISSLTIACIGLVMMLIRNQTFAVVGVFLYSAGFMNAYCTIATFITEFFPEENSSQYFNLISFSFAVGIAINPVAFYFIYDWKKIVIYIFLIPTVVTLLGFILIIQNTPIELIAYDDYVETYQAFIRIAQWNGKFDHGLTIEGVKEIKQEYDQNQRKKHAKVFGIIDLFRYKSLRSNLFPLGCLRFIAMFLYYAPSLLLGQFQLDIYINGLILAFSKLCVIPIQYYMLKFERKLNAYLMFAISAFFSVSMYVAKLICYNCEDNNIFQSILLFAYRLATTVLTFMVVVMMNEVYPAQVRNLAATTINFIGRPSVLFVPFVVSFCEKTSIPFFILLAFWSIAGIGATFFATETLGIPPPELIEEVRMQDHNYQFYQKENVENRE